ncbi:MAG: glycosyltransferase [Anaerolineae bacterium]|nr:glycosyltransferase [Anaerolineae bacterium]
MRIVHVYKDYYPVLGGIENHVRVLAEAQAAAGHEVTVLVCDPSWRSRRAELGGVRVIRAGRLATVASMPISVAQPAILARLSADVVHVQSPYPLGEVSAWALKPRTPLVISYQSDVVRQQAILRFYGPLLRRVLRSAERIIASTPRYVETSPWLGPEAARCVVVPLSVDTERFSPAPQLPSGPPSILFVGVLRYYKGLDTLLRALTLVPDAQLTVVGDGPMRGAWEALARELSLADRVRFVGRVDDAALPGWYRAANLYVLPANVRAEAFGIALLEAMASGLPCITTEVGTGTSWVVQDGVTGRVVPAMDHVALAGAIQQLYDPNLRARMGAAGRRRAETTFTAHAMLEGVMRVYEEAIAARG